MLLFDEEPAIILQMATKRGSLSEILIVYRHAYIKNCFAFKDIQKW